MDPVIKSSVLPIISTTKSRQHLPEDVVRICSAAKKCLKPESPFHKNFERAKSVYGADPRPESLLKRQVLHVKLPKLDAPLKPASADSDSTSCDSLPQGQLFEPRYSARVVVDSDKTCTWMREAIKASELKGLFMDTSAQADQSAALKAALYEATDGRPARY